MCGLFFHILIAENQEFVILILKFVRYTNLLIVMLDGTKIQTTT